MATVDLGKVRITFGGPFNSSQAYERLTIVDGPFNVKYISINDVPAGTSLSDTNYWTPLSGQFVEQYQGSHSTNPATRNDGSALQVGDLYFDTSTKEMRVYDGSIWKSAGSSINGTAKRQTFTGDGSTTSFAITGGYDANFADVYLNGVKLVNGQDVDVSSGTDVVFTTAPAAGDVIDVVAYGSFQLADMYTKAEIDQNHYTKAEIDQGQVVLNAIKNVDGAGSGLDADKLDGIDSGRIVYGDNWTKTTNTDDFVHIMSGFYISGTAPDRFSSNWHHLIHCRNTSDTNNRAFQIGSDFLVDDVRFRRIELGVPTPWRKIWHEGDAEASLAETGYQKLPSGLIIQWGRAQNGTGSNSNRARATFPIAFTSWRVITAIEDRVNSTNSAFLVTDVTRVISGLNVLAEAELACINYDGSAHTYSGDYVYWIAIGQ